MSRAERILFGESEASPAAAVVSRSTSPCRVSRASRWSSRAAGEARHYALAFVDMRMPPGWDGLETIERLWAVDPHVQVVICSAHSDYDWTDFVERLGLTDKLLVLKKPFEPIEVLQCAQRAHAQVARRAACCAVRSNRSKHVVTARTEGLEAANRQLRHLATHDALTGLPNRVLLDDRLAQAIAHADRDAAAVRRAGARPRPLQARQRFARPSRRRRAAERSGAAPRAASCAASTPSLASAATNSCSSSTRAERQDAVEHRAARDRRHWRRRSGSRASICTSRTQHRHCVLSGRWRRRRRA